MGGDHEAVADLWETNAQGTSAEANARLIAAAPDQHATLLMISTSLKAWANSPNADDWPMHFRALAAAADAAIAKARGE